MANRFKVLVGTHIEGGKSYSKGDIVVSDANLMKFRGKFADLGEGGAVSRAGVTSRAGVASRAPVEVDEETDSPQRRTHTASPHHAEDRAPATRASDHVTVTSKQGKGHKTSVSKDDFR